MKHTFVYATGLSTLGALVLTTASIIAADSAPTIVSRGPHHRLWQSTTEAEQADGTKVIVTNSYTELSTGICYQDPTTLQWLDTREEFALVLGRAVAKLGPHQLTLEANINNDARCLPSVRMVNNLLANPGDWFFATSRPGNKLLWQK